MGIGCKKLGDSCQCIIEGIRVKLFKGPCQILLKNRQVEGILHGSCGCLHKGDKGILLAAQIKGLPGFLVGKTDAKRIIHNIS